MESMAASRYLRAPQQARSRETLNRLLEATRELLAERGFDEISVEDIARRAGSSKGSFYQRFPDKDSLLLFLIERESERARKRWRAFLRPERWSDGTLREFLDAFVDRLLEIYRQRRHLMRAFAQRVAVVEDEEVRRHARELNETVLEGLRAVVSSKREQVAHPDPEAACVFLVRFLSAAMPSLLLGIPGGDREPSDGSVVEPEIRRMVAAYLIGLQEG